MKYWKDIQDFEGLYQVNTIGEVRSLTRARKNKKGNIQVFPGKDLKIFWKKEPNSYYGHAVLSKNNIRYDCLVHRLVAQTFLENPENKVCINHIDNDGSNNKIENLEWCSHSENMIHAQKQGRLFSSQSKGGQLGSKTNLSKLEKKFDAIKNTTIGKWTVLDEPFAFKRCKKFYINCICSCGNIKALEIGRVIRNEVSGCMSCRSL